MSAPSAESDDGVNKVDDTAVVRSGQLYTWGRGGQGQLGQQKTLNPKPNCALPTPVPGLRSVTYVAVGEGQQACVLAADAAGALWAFGNNYKGRLGLGSASPRHVLKPTRVKSLSEYKVVGAAVGEGHAGARTACGRLFLWGHNHCGCLGDGSTQDRLDPIQVPMRGVTYFDCSNYASAAIVDSDLYVWGSNEQGRLGLGLDAKKHTFISKPARVALGSSVGMVSLGSLYSAAVTTDGKLYTWGYGGHGNLGLGTRASHNAPQRVNVTRDGKSIDVVSVACTRGQNACKGGLNPKAGGAEGPHTVAIARDGDMYTFGTCHKGLLMNLGNKTGGFNKPWDCSSPYRVGSRFANGKLTTRPRSEFAIPPPYDRAGPWVAAVSAHIHAAAINVRGEAWAWGCGSNDGRCGVQRFLNGPGGRVDTMKCYMMGPHRVGVATSKWWKGKSLRDKRVLQIATGRNTMAAIAVPLEHKSVSK